MGKRRSDRSIETPAQLRRCIEAGLAPLNVPPAWREPVIGILLDGAHFLLLKAPRIRSTSAVFDYPRKLRNTVALLSQWGMTYEAYRATVIRCPKALLTAPETIASNIVAVVELLRPSGLTGPAYVKAALRQPTLLLMSSETVAANIRGVIKRFAGEGLTEPAYLKAAVRQPQLFYQSPDKIEHNVRALERTLRDCGVTMSDYLRGALRHPPLFCQRPATIARHIELIGKLYDRGGMRIEGAPDSEAHRARNRRPAFEWLLRVAPQALSYGDDNLRLRLAYLDICGTPDANILNPHRANLERRLAEHLGHYDMDAPVKARGGERTRSYEEYQGRDPRALLCALIVSGYIKSLRLK